MKSFLYLLFIALLLSSCKKSDNAPDHSALLRSGKWKMTAYEVRMTVPGSPKDDSVFNMFKVIDSCQMDDYIVFQESYKGIVNTGLRKCGAQSNELLFNWELRDNQKTLMINNLKYLMGDMSPLYDWYTGLDYVEATIKKINTTSFTITYRGLDSDPPGTILPAIYDYTQVFSKM